MKITVEFGNGPALALAPESLSLTQLNAEQIALVGTVGTYAIPIVSFPGSLATAEEIAARIAPKSVVVEAEFTPDADLCLAPTAGYSCSLNAGHCGDFHAAYEDHDIQRGALIGRSPVAPKSSAEVV